MNFPQTLAWFIINLFLLFSTKLTFPQVKLWQKTNLQCRDNVTALVVDSNGYIFAGTYNNGIFRSMDHGNNWAQVDSGLTSKRVHCLTTSAYGVVYAGTDDGVFCSKDNGASWNKIGLSNTTVRCIIEVNGSLLAGTGSILSMFESNLSKSTSSGVFRSNDDGKMWIMLGLLSPVTSLAINSKGHIFAGTEGGATFHSTDRYVLRSSGAQVLRSINDGISWSPVVETSFSANIVTALAVNSNDDILAGTDKGVFLSVDESEQPFLPSLSFGRKPRERRWSSVYGIPDAMVYTIVLNSDGYALAGTEKGVFHSTNEFRFWTPINTGLTNTIVLSLAIDSNGNIFAGTSDGVFRAVFTIEYLIASLNNPDPNARIFAVEMLGYMKDDRAISPLIRALKDRDESVRLQVVTALGRIKATSTIEPLIDALVDSSPVVRSLAASQLANMRNVRAVKPLIRTLTDSVNYVRNSAEHALREIGKEAVPALIETLKSLSTDLRCSVIKVLGEIKDPQSVEPIIALLNDPNPLVRKEAVKAIELTNDIRKIDFLVAASKDSSPEVRQSAISALSWINNIRILEILIAALSDEEKNVRHQAVSVLNLKMVQKKVHIEAGSPLATSLIVYLKSPDPEVRKIASKTLGEIKDSSAVMPLIHLLNDENKDVRLETVIAFQNIKDTRSIVPLFKNLSDSDDDVRLNTVLALGEMKDTSVVVPLIGMLRDKSVKIQMAAENVLTKIGKPVVEYLITNLKENDYSALRVLRQITGEYSLGDDPQKWQKWWKKNKQNYITAPK